MRTARGILLAGLFAGALWVSALVTALCVASPGYPCVTCIALLPLLHAIKRLRVTTAYACGLFWGGCLFAFCAQSACMPATNGWAAALVLATVPAAFAAVGALVTRHHGFRPLLLSLGWVGVELSLAPLGFRNGLLASAPLTIPVLHTLGVVLGYVLVALLIVYANAIILALADRTRVAPAATFVRRHIAPAAHAWVACAFTSPPDSRTLNPDRARGPPRWCCA